MLRVQSLDPGEQLTALLLELLPDARLLLAAFLQLVVRLVLAHVTLLELFA